MQRIWVENEIVAIKYPLAVVIIVDIGLQHLTKGGAKEAAFVIDTECGGYFESGGL